ncbi:hypothetical protein MKZ38_004103 [Zalerion maritima]|uniref:Uncharacterized protein n=1 Tax=Zalerion maritima TaxID=339359 RepID=A0AAD5RY72_9PEZI|nr:hypothetical protein MKZ38_004103 [Zalerion maritima]
MGRSEASQPDQEQRKQGIGKDKQPEFIKEPEKEPEKDQDGDTHIPSALPLSSDPVQSEQESDDAMSERKNQDRHTNVIPQPSFLACLPPHEIEDPDRNGEFKTLVKECKSTRKDREGWKDRIRSIRCDGRVMGQAGAAVAEAVSVFGRIDIMLCCKSEAVVGTVEELSTSPKTKNLVRDQFETIFFSQVNFIKAALPVLRHQHTGHIMILSSIGGHIGTPGMPMYTAATWALEGFCDSLAYEIAPFNIKVTIVQPNKEIQSLTNKIIFAPQLPYYDSEYNPAPSIRDMLGNVLNLNPETALMDNQQHHQQGGLDEGEGFGSSTPEIVHRYPKLPQSSIDRLVMETVHALTAIGGHENPPARHIVGFEGSVAVKEKLKTVTEELEDFVEATLSVDIFDSELKAEAARERMDTADSVTAGFLTLRFQPTVAPYRVYITPLHLLWRTLLVQDGDLEPKSIHPTRTTPLSYQHVAPPLDGHDTSTALKPQNANARMSLDSLVPITPARVKALLLPVGQIKLHRFASFVETLKTEHVVHLRDVSADGRPNRNMFSPLAFPEGAIFYDLSTHSPPPSHLALTPFDLYREPLAIIAIADGTEMNDESFSRRMSINGAAPSLIERNIRALYQELEDLRDQYSKVLVHQVLIFDYVPPEDSTFPMPEGVISVPPVDQHKRTTMRTIMCDISSLLLAEMTTLAKSFEAMSFVDSPGQAPLGSTPTWSSTDDTNPATRRNSQFSLPTSSRSASATGLGERKNIRMSMPAFKSGENLSASSTPIGRPTTPVGSQLAQPPTTFDDIAERSPMEGPNPKRAFPGARPDTAEGFRSASQDRVSVQGFGPGGPNDRFRVKGKGRVSIVLGSLYLQAGLWSNALTHFIDGATVARSVNDHIWHGKALELITVALILLGHNNLEFLVPNVLLPQPEKGEKQPTMPEPAIIDPSQPKWLRNFQSIIPGLMDRIVVLYSKISTESLPPLAFSEAVIRFSRIMAALHIADGILNEDSFRIMVYGALPDYAELTTSPRLIVTPQRSRICTLLFKAFPAQTGELLSTTDRCVILSGIASVLGSIGFQRKKMMVTRELISVLTGGLVEARTRGAAEVGIHPAAGLVALNSVGGQTNGAGALELGEGDIEFGMDVFLGMLCKTYGIVGPYTNWEDAEVEKPVIDDSDEAVISRIKKQSVSRFYGLSDLKLNILRACINFSEALPDFNGVLRFSSDLLRTAGSGIAPGSRREDASAVIPREEQIRLVTNISKTSSLANRLGLSHLTAEFWDEFLIRGIVLEPLPQARTPVAHSRTQLETASKERERASHDINPFIYNPFLKENSKSSAVDTLLVAGETATFKFTIQNPFDLDIDIEEIKLDTEGVAFESQVESTAIGPYRTQLLKVSGFAKEAGALKVTGAVLKVKGCRERRFPIFTEPWRPKRDEKVKALGVEVLDKSLDGIDQTKGPTPSTIDLSVIKEQPTVTIKSSTLPQASVMILEGERQPFCVTLENSSTTTPADFLLFSFTDSTQAPLQTAINNRDASPAELYEYELVLAKKQALRLKKKPQDRFIPPGGTKSFEFEILGKPGLTSGTVQIDYAYLGGPKEEIEGDRFYTRRVALDLRVTVNASVEVTRVDVVPLDGEVPSPLWTSAGGLVGETDGKREIINPADWCLLMMDLRNAWPCHMRVHLEIGARSNSDSEDGKVKQELTEQILPGNTSRIIFLIRRVFLPDPHASIPVLNPGRQRQFVVSTSRITPDMERANREAFWYREKILDMLKGSWKTLVGPEKAGEVEMRKIKLTGRMVEAVRVEEVGVEVAVVPVHDKPKDMPVEYEEEEGSISKIAVDGFVQIRTKIINRSTTPIYPTLRIMPALCHRPLNVSLDLTRKWAWNGTLQQHLPLLQAGEAREVNIGATALCRGEFEITASVEETKVWHEKKAKGDEGEEEGAGGQGRRPRSDTQSLIDALIGPKERRIWCSRRPAYVVVGDGDGE